WLSWAVPHPRTPAPFVASIAIGPTSRATIPGPAERPLAARVRALSGTCYDVPRLDQRPDARALALGQQPLELAGVDRLADHRDVGTATGEAFDRVAGHDRAPDVRPALAHRFEQAHPIEPGHREVGQHELGLRLALLDQLERMAAVPGDADFEAEVAQLFRQDQADALVVVDDQHRGNTDFRAMAAIGLRAGTVGAPRRRQVHLDRRAVPAGAFDPEQPARLLDEAGDHRQPEPGALSGRLGGEERLGHPLEQLGWDAFALVLDADAQELAGLRMRRRLRTLEGHANGSALGHGVARVDQQVDQRQLQLRRVDEEGRDVVGNVPFDRGPVAQRVRDETVDAVAQAARIDACGGQLLLAGKGHQPTHE